MAELLQIMEDWNGYEEAHKAQKLPDYERRLKETIDLITNTGLPKHRREFLIKEAMTTSDFPLLFADTLDRSLLASYKATTPVYRAIGRKKNNVDFKAAKLFSMTGGDEHLEEVAEKAEFPGSSRTEGKYEHTIKKYGRIFEISWESIINDALGALQDTPERFSRATTRTESRVVTTLYAGDAGTHAAGNLYESGVNMSSNLLTINNLGIAISNQVKMTDAGSEPIMNRPKILVVPPDLEITAREILTSAVKMWLETSGGAAVPYPTVNALAQEGIQLVVEPYLPILDTTNGTTGWYLFSDPNEIAALAYGWLAGHETPEICMKASDKVSLGGGLISPMEGDIESDNIKYRVRLCFGATKLDWRGTYMGGKVS